MIFVIYENMFYTFSLKINECLELILAYGKDRSLLAFFRSHFLSFVTFAASFRLSSSIAA